MKQAWDHRAMSVLLLILFMTTLGCLASPHNTTTGSDLQRRQCVYNTATESWDCDFNLPKFEEIITRFRDTSDRGLATAANSVWQVKPFYTNWGEPIDTNYPELFAFCKAWFDAQGLGSYYVGDGVNQDWRGQQDKWVIDHMNDFIQANAGDYPGADTPLPIWFWCYFEGTAAAALNPDAFVFTPYGLQWPTDRIWATIEFPALTRNPNIERIWRVDPRPGSPGCGEKILVWDRSRGDFRMGGWRCPV